MTKPSTAARRLVALTATPCEHYGLDYWHDDHCEDCELAVIDAELRRVAFHAWLRGFDYGVVDVPSMESGTARTRDIDAILAGPDEEGKGE